MKATAYLLQAALIGAWWVGLASNPAFFEAFQYVGISSTAFWAFLAPDVLMIGLLSILRAYRGQQSLEFIILGAFGYAALYCCNATLLTASGFLPTGLMVLGLFYNVFLCFNKSLFRTSKTNFARNALKTFFQILCVWILALVVVPFVILDAFNASTAPTPGAPFFIGLVLLALFSSLGLISAYFMVRYGNGTPVPLDQPNRLVVTGPYRIVRNPMAVAGIGQGISVAILFTSIPILVYAMLGALVWHLVVRPIEERDMIDRFGEPYLEYRQRVKCWLPTFESKD